MGRNPLWLSVVLLSAAACGPGDGTGFYAQGALRVTATDAMGGVTEMPIRFTQRTRVDPTLPAGQASGLVGTCTVGPTGRTLHLTLVNNPMPGLRDVYVTMQPWENESCTDCRLGQITLAVDQATFVGEQRRGGGSAGACTFTATRRGSLDMTLAVQCSGLTSQSDPRRLDVDLNYTLESCDGAETRN